MRSDLNHYINKNKDIVQKEIKSHLNKLNMPEQLKKATLYSFMAGGKKLRPILLIASYEAYGKNPKRTLSSAVALEMIHTYSLIHDDLPAMDNDDLRRGMPTNHKAFDEATAILAGDALLTYSFSAIANDPLIETGEKVTLIQMLAEASGPIGMVAGQVLDMEAEKNPVTLEELENIHTLKTGKLLTFGVTAGAYLAGATKNQLEHLKEFSYYLGLIFQVQDDILDVTGDPEKLGKPVGSDLENEKSTYTSLLGITGAEDKMADYVIKAKKALEKAAINDSYLMDLTDYLSQRDH